MLVYLLVIVAAIPAFLSITLFLVLWLWHSISKWQAQRAYRQ